MVPLIKSRDDTIFLTELSSHSTVIPWLDHGIQSGGFGVCGSPPTQKIEEYFLTSPRGGGVFDCYKLFKKSVISLSLRKQKTFA